MFNKGSADATFTLKSSIQILHEHNLEAYVLFIDLVKAFDSVNRELLWKILEIYGVPQQLINIIIKLHTNVEYIIKIGKENEFIPATVGVKQGDNLGPILFIIFINAVITTIDDNWQNIKIPKVRHHGFKPNSNILKYNPDMKKKIRHTTKGITFTYNKSLYIDDAAFLFLSRKDLELGSKIIVKHYK